jgi:hypothetical protein
MKTKSELQADLTAAGIPFDDALTVPQLQELAKENGIDLKRVILKPEVVEEILDEILPPPVLSLTDDAVEVLKRQREADALQVIEAIV